MERKEGNVVFSKAAILETCRVLREWPPSYVPLWQVWIASDDALTDNDKAKQEKGENPLEKGGRHL